MRERILYAPMSGAGGIVYDKDAVYIDDNRQQDNQVNNLLWYSHLLYYIKAILGFEPSYRWSKT